MNVLKQIDPNQEDFELKVLSEHAATEFEKDLSEVTIDTIGRNVDTWGYYLDWINVYVKEDWF